MIFFSYLKKCTNPSNEFLLHRIEWKNAQVLLMSFSYKGIAKKCTSPSNEFLLHWIEWKNAQVILMSFSYKGIAKNAQVLLMSFSYKRANRRTSGQWYIRTYIYPPLDKRYSPIISPICGPKNSADCHGSIEAYIVASPLKLIAYQGT